MNALRPFGRGAFCCVAGSFVSPYDTKVTLALKGRLTWELVDSDRCPKGFTPDLFKRAKNKLFVVLQANRLRDLEVPPGNRLEALSGDRQGQHSIRINDQWRICFRWTEAGATDVEVVDYH